jgi:hypothetical protein
MNEPLLIEAVKADDVNWAQMLIKGSKDLKKKDDYARAALNWEGACSDSAMVLLLLEAGAKQPDCVGRPYPLKAFGQFPVPTDFQLTADYLVYGPG